MDFNEILCIFIQLLVMNSFLFQTPVLGEIYFCVYSSVKNVVGI